jgi:hypothetical protein
VPPLVAAHVQIIFPSYWQLQLVPWQVACHVLPLPSLHVYVVGPPGPAEPLHVRPTGEGFGMLSHPGGGVGGGFSQLARAVSCGTQPVACAMPFMQVSAPGWAVQSRNAVHWLPHAIIAMLSACAQLDSQACTV